MKIISLDYDLPKKRYTFEFEQNGVNFFRFLDRIVIEDTEELKKWMNSLLEKARYG